MEKRGWLVEVVSEPREVLIQKQFFIDFTKAQSLSSAIEAPFFAFSKTRLLQNYSSFTSMLPGVKVMYAVKANPHVKVLRALAQAGSGFDAACGTEIGKLVALGVSPASIIFSHPIKLEGDLLFAKAHGVKRLVFDNSEELRKIARLYPDAELILRLAVSNYSSKVQLSKKFGCQLQEALPLLLEAKSLGLNPIGLSFHVGSRCDNPMTFAYAIDDAYNLFQEAKKQGIELKLLDIGGGFLVPSTPVFSHVCKTINHCLQKFEGVEVVAEPGTGLVEDVFILVTKVIGKSVRFGKLYYYLDQGIYSAFLDTVISKASFNFYSNRTGPRKACTLAGPTCDSPDVVAKHIFLPELDLNDVLLVPNAGAYTYAMTTTFNGFKKPKVIQVD